MADILSMLCITLRVTFVMVLVIVSSVGRNLALPWRTQMDCSLLDSGLRQRFRLYLTTVVWGLLSLHMTSNPMT